MQNEPRPQAACPFCGELHPEGSLYCPKTGQKIPRLRFCLYCGKQIELDWVVCAFCGRPQGENAPAPSPAPIQPHAPAPAWQPASPPRPWAQVNPQQPSRRYLWWILGAAGGLILILLAAVLLPNLGAGGGALKKPPRQGVYLETSSGYKEMEQFRGSPGAVDSPGIPAAESSRPVVLMNLPGANLAWMLLQSEYGDEDLGEHMPFDAEALEDGMYELRPSAPLAPGGYCYVQGDPLGMPYSLPTWCFVVGSGRGAAATPTLPRVKAQEPTKAPPPPTLEPTRVVERVLEPTLAADAVGAEAASPDWKMEGYDLARTNFNRVETSLRPPLELVWEQAIDDYAVDGLTVSGGRIALGGMGPGGSNQVVLLDANTGERLWDFVLTGGGRGAMNVSPVFEGGNVYFGGQADSGIYAMNVESGLLAWVNYAYTSFYASQFAVTRGWLLAPDSAAGPFALNAASGETAWGRGTGASGASLAVQGDAVFSVVTFGSKRTLVARNLYDGRSLWEYQGVSGFAPIVADEQRVYTFSAANRVIALNIRDGSLAWQSPVSGVGGLRPALVGDRLFVPLKTGGVAALDARTGEQFWRAGTGTYHTVTAANGVLYVSGFSTGHLMALSPEDGKMLWSQKLSGHSYGTLAVANGRLYLASTSQQGEKSITHLYCFGGSQ